MIELKTIKILTKRPWKTIRNQNKKDQIEIHKNFHKRVKGKKLKVEGRIEKYYMHKLKTKC